MDTAINIKHLFAFVKENIINDVYRHQKAIYYDRLMATAIIIPLYCNPIYFKMNTLFP